GFQTAGFLMDHGMLDLVEPRESVRRAIRNLRGLHRVAEESRADDTRAQRLPDAEGAEPVSDPAAVTTRPAWDVVQLAREIERPHTLDYIGFVFEDFVELHGDRLFEEDSAIVEGPAMLGNVAVMVIGHQKGKTTSELVERNFGML